MGNYDVDFRDPIYQNVLEAMPGGMFIYRADRDEEVVYANSHLLDFFECKTMEEFVELTGGKFATMIHPDDMKSTKNEIAAQILAGTDHFDHISYRIITRTGKIRSIEDYGRRVEIPGVGIFYYVFVVDYDVKYLTQDMDPLTGLPGQKHFNEYASRLHRQCRMNQLDDELVYIYINIMKFKMINMRYGLDKGDEVLREMADMLQEVFNQGYVSRFGNDHFVVLTKAKDVDEKIDRIDTRIHALVPGIHPDYKAGIYKCVDYTMTPELCCDLAKLACDSIRSKPDIHTARYTDEMSRRITIQNYVLDHLDEAIENHYIKVYYQPVVRSITGNLCGMEALARWIDPQVGFLSPGDFVPALEEAHLIHKLDAFIIHEVCREYRERYNRGWMIVPVSFNLSRLDFVLSDIGQVIEDAVTEYEVPHSMLNIEITESMFVKGANRITKEVERFHSKGYKVWMDDFGSGYSSLNVLKDFEFDELKIDMAFLSSFTQKSRDILESTVRMAKQINIQTLAEGVETLEQYQFLKNIGCEKIQGYYFGKPQPYEDSIQHCINQGMKIETGAWSDYYDKVGKVNFLSDRPVALIEDDGEFFHYLFANQAYMDVLLTNGTTSTKVDEETMNNLASPMHSLFRSFADRTLRSDGEETMTYPSGSQYMRVTARTIARCNGHCIFALHTTNITVDMDDEEKKHSDLMVRNIFYLYTVAALFDLEADTVELLNALQDISGVQRARVERGVDRVLARYMKEFIFVEDQPAFLRFVDVDTLRSRTEETKTGCLTSIFRTRDSSGNYGWYVYTLLRIPKGDANLYLILGKRAAVDDPEIRNTFIRSLQQGDQPLTPTTVTDSGQLDMLLWKNVRAYSRVKYFWKDMDRRFIGVSQSFLDYYGLKSADDVIGKTDEDMRWHVAESPYKCDEEAILSQGIRTNDVPGKCIIKGVLHDIVSSKMPLYRDGKIIGLIGYFTDAEEFRDRRGETVQVAMTDTVTGLSNSRGIMDHAIVYGEEYKKNGVDFAAINLQVDGHENFAKNYGEQNGDDLLREITRIIMSHFGTSASVGRLRNSEFIIFYHYRDQSELVAQLDGIRGDMEKLIQVNQHPCTCYPKIRVTYATDHDSFESMLKSLLGVHL